METLKLTMKENNKTIINNIDTKMETIFKEFQIYLIRSTAELVQIVNLNKQRLSDNVARLSQVYDEATNSVARSNTSHNNSSQAQTHSENRQHSFPGYQLSFHPSQMITRYPNTIHTTWSRCQLTNNNKCNKLILLSNLYEFKWKKDNKKLRNINKAFQSSIRRKTQFK